MTDKKMKKTEYNAKLMSDLLLAAKGPRRTSLEFCQQSGISPSSFSRYANGLKKRPCPVELLKKVAEHADPASQVTLEQLLAANGDHEAYDYDSRPQLTKNETIGILTTALLFNRYECHYPEDVKPIDIMGLTYSPSWCINTNAVDGCSQRRWDFLFWQQLTDLATEAERFIRQLLMLVAIVHLGYPSFDKLTFVFSSTSLYTEILERTKNLHLDFLASFLLIDPADKVIIEEHPVASTIKNDPLCILPTDTLFSQVENSLLSVDEKNIL